MNFIFAILTLAAAVSSKRDFYKYSSNNQEGLILSNGFPYSYNSSEPENYYFRGQEDEKVQIIFDQFNLYRKSTNQRCGTDNSYISYKRTENGPVENFCGDKKPLPIMSEGKDFHLQYNPIRVPPNTLNKGDNILIGFNATYRFVKNYGVDAGKQDPSSYSCEFVYDSQENLTGVINSPNFPGFFPVPVTCYYTFISHETNIVFNFTEFDLIGSDDCDAERGKNDMLQILLTSDGTAKGSPYRYCGKKDSFVVAFTNKTIFLIYTHQFSNYSDYELANYPYVGFRATYQFTNDTVNSSNINKLRGLSILHVGVFVLLNKQFLKF